MCIRSMAVLLKVKSVIWFPENALVSKSEILQLLNLILAADGNESEGILAMLRISLNSAINSGCCDDGKTLGLNDNCSKCNTPTFFMIILSIIAYYQPNVG